MNKKSFCVLPWIHSFVNVGGHYQVCCTGEEFGNYILDESGKTINVLDGKDQNQIMNSQFMKDLRLKMLNGELPKICTRCIATEEAQGNSRRLIENENFKVHIEDLINDTAEDGGITPNIRLADYRLGNICNLECRMCGPKTSKPWLKNYSEIKKDLIDEDIDSDDLIMDLSKLDWIDKEDLIKDFQNKAKDLEQLHFGGGEPLLANKMADLLEFCVKENFSKNIIISYNTNLTKLPKRVLELWKEFKGIKLLVSIDAYGDLNNYLRYPSKWEEIDTNLKYLDENYDQFNLKEILISTTVQIDNVLHLNDLISYLEGFKNIKPFPNLVNLYFPAYLRTNVLPKIEKKKAYINLKNIFQKYQNKLDESDKYLLDNIDQCANFLMNKISDKEYEELQKQYHKFTSRYDKLHKINYTNSLLGK